MLAWRARSGTGRTSIGRRERRSRILRGRSIAERLRFGAPAPARQIAIDVGQLVIEDELFCDTTVVGPACDRPGLTQIGGLTVTYRDGTSGHFNAWLEPNGRVAIYDNQPRFNQSD